MLNMSPRGPGKREEKKTKVTIFINVPIFQQ